jgi:CRP-like cAMP-binding protein/ATP/ADP translocase/HEAT repeat protein
MAFTRPSLEQRLSTLFDVQADESRPVGLFILYYFLLSVGVNFTLAAGYALFVAEFGPRQLPLSYLAVAVMGLVLSAAFELLSQRVNIRQLAPITLGFMIVVSVAIWLGLTSTQASWLGFLLPAWFLGVMTLVNLAFWSVVDGIYDGRQSRRLYAVLGSGNWLGAVAVGIVTTPLVNLFGTTILFPLAAVSIVGALIVQRAIFQLKPAEPDTQPMRRKSASLGELLNNNYVVAVLGLVVVWWLCFYFIDNIFFDRAALQYPDAVQLASMLGLLAGLQGLIALIVSLFLGGQLLGRFGLQAGLLITPLLLLLAVGAFAIIGTLDRTSTLLFGLVALAKAISMGMGFSIDQSSQTVLYQALPEDQRLRTMTLADGLVQALGIGLAGVVLYIFGTLLEFRTVQLAYAVLILLVLWIATVTYIMRAYPLLLTQALRKRLFGETHPTLTDGASLGVLRESLQEQHPEVVLYAMNLLQQANDDAFILSLPELLNHPTAEVRLEALHRIERLNLITATGAVRRSLETERDPLVREAAIRTLGAIGRDEDIGTLMGYLTSAADAERRGAMIGLLRGGNRDGVLAAGERLLTLISAPEAPNRALAAGIVGEIGVRSYYHSLESLLQDADREVVRTAVIAAGKVKAPALWPLVAKQLSQRDLRKTAALALAAGGDGAVPALSEVITQSPAPPTRTLSQVIRIFGRMRGESVSSYLVSLHDHNDPAIRTQVLSALSTSGYYTEIEHAPWVREQIKAEAAFSMWVLAALQDIGEDEALNLLIDALQEALNQSRERVFSLLSIIHPRQTILKVKRALSQAAKDAQAEKSDKKDDKERTNAVGIVESLLIADLKPYVLPLIDTISSAQRIERLKGLIEPAHTTREVRLTMIIRQQGIPQAVWTRACALYAVGKLRIAECGESVRMVQDSDEALIRETAAWALERLNKNPERPAMLSTVEKVIILKTVGIFSGIPNDVLAEVASLLEEQEIAPGQTVFKKGDLGDSMYIIISGKVRVHDGDHLLNYLDERDVFGEMALLDPEPRIASVTAEEETRLFRLDQDAFYELMEDYGEVARGIIRVLTGYLRARVRDVADLHRRIQLAETDSARH